MKYILLFVFFACTFNIEAQEKKDEKRAPFEILTGADGTRYICRYGDTVGFSKPISREELRSSRDMFFYQRGDTIYFLYDSTDSLQNLTRKPDKILVRWNSRPETESEKMSWDILDVEYDRDLCVMFYLEPKQAISVFSEDFVKYQRLVTREELVAFFHREKRRRSEAYKRTKNLEYEHYHFDTFVRDYFLVSYMFIPVGDGTYKLYKSRIAI